MALKKGDRVIYIPTHAEGYKSHKDYEHGVVSSANAKYIFVKYDSIECRMITGNEPYTAVATRREDLILEQS